MISLCESCSKPKYDPLIRVEGPVIVLGNIHGSLTDLQRIFAACGPPPLKKYIILGDMVDHGQESLETFMFLLSTREQFPHHLYLIRGNHECAPINRIYGLYDECKKYGGKELWESVNHCMTYLPLAAVVNNKVLCVHGGLSPEMRDIEAIHNLSFPVIVPDNGLITDLLWSSYVEHSTEWKESDRGISFTFGAPVLEKFLLENNLDLLVNAQKNFALQNGGFFSQKGIISIVSCSNYCGEFGNKASFIEFADNSSYMIHSIE